MAYPGLHAWHTQTVAYLYYIYVIWNNFMEAKALFFTLLIIYSLSALSNMLNGADTALLLLDSRKPFMFVFFFNFNFFACY